MLPLKKFSVRNRRHTIFFSWPYGVLVGRKKMEVTFRSEGLQVLLLLAEGYQHASACSKEEHMFLNFLAFKAQ